MGITEIWTLVALILHFCGVGAFAEWPALLVRSHGLAAHLKYGCSCSMAQSWHFACLLPYSEVRSNEDRI